MAHTATDLGASSSPVVIVGAGHAGVQAAVSLREDGFQGEIVLLSSEADLPYQRPPLSKAFLKGEMDIHGLPLRAEAFFHDQGIDLRLGVARDRNRPRSPPRPDQRRPRVDYGHLILATGARGGGSMRQASICPGVFMLRTIADATAIRERLSAGRKVVVIGAGFIGLEDRGDREQASAPPSQWWRLRGPWGAPYRRSCRISILKTHTAFGARFRMGRGVTEIRGAGRRRPWF